MQPQKYNEKVWLIDESGNFNEANLILANDRLTLKSNSRPIFEVMASLFNATDIDAVYHMIWEVSVADAKYKVSFRNAPFATKSKLFTYLYMMPGRSGNRYASTMADGALNRDLLISLLKLYHPIQLPVPYGWKPINDASVKYIKHRNFKWALICLIVVILGYVVVAITGGGP